MRKVILLLVLTILILTGCSSDKGDFISEDVVTIRVLSKQDNGNLLFVMDEDTGDMFDIRVENFIFYAVDIDDLIEGTKKLYKDKKGDVKAYYTINTKKYNNIREEDVKNAEELIVETVEVIVKEKYEYKSKTYNALLKTYTSTYHYCVVYKEQDNDYYINENISLDVYNSIKQGDVLLADKTKCILKDGSVKESYKLIKIKK